MLAFIQVLMLTTGLVNLLVAGLMYAIFRTEDDRSAKLWIAGSMLLAAGFLILVVRPHVPSIIGFGVANFIMLYAMVLYRNSFVCLVQPDYKASRIPLFLCLLDGILIQILKEAGLQNLLSLTAAIAWVLMYVWMTVSVAALHVRFEKLLFRAFMIVTVVGMLVWMFRVYLAAGFGISMATDATTLNLFSLTLTHLALMAQQIVYLVARLTDEKDKKKKIQELKIAVDTMWSERQTLDQARQEERDQLLRDMHDGFGSQLATLRMLAEKGRITPQELPRYLKEVSADLHLVVDTLGQTELTLEEALVDFRHRTERRREIAEFSMDWRIDLNGLPALSSRVILQILRIVQEAIHNAMRHANPSRLCLSFIFDRASGVLAVVISDDGVGIPDEPRAGRGVSNMRYRAREIGAKLQIDRLQPGTAIALSLPLAAAAPGVMGAPPALVHNKS